MTPSGTARPGAPAPVGCLVPAAGLGLRLGAGVPKALHLLAGEPLLVHAIRGLRQVPAVGPVVVAAPPGELEAVRALLAPYDVAVVAGGASRQESVGRALVALPAEVELVLVHDAARCLVPTEVVTSVVDALRAGADAVVPVLPLADTVKQVDADRVVATVDRSTLRAVQTPQGFRREVLHRAHAAGAHAAGAHAAGLGADAAGLGAATDDAGLVEALGGIVRTVPGSDEAFKITRPFDLQLAESVLVRRTEPGGRHAG